MSGGIRIESATIRILRTEFGRFPHILPLNPELRPGSPSLRVTLEVVWVPPDAVPLLRRYEQELSRLLPELFRHRCRGPSHYHFARMGESEEEEGSAQAEVPAARGGARPSGVEPALALVHLAEHLAIDVIAFVTELESVSGVTAAQASSDGRFELFVECPQSALAPLAVYQAFSWLAILLRGDALAASERILLPLGRALYRHRGRSLDAVELSAETGLRESAVTEALGRLDYLGVACRVSREPDDSAPGEPRYILCADREATTIR